MVMSEFELTKEFTFYGDSEDMHEIVDAFNRFNAKKNEPNVPHIAHWVDDSGCDQFALWVEDQRYNFDMSDLLEACFRWALINTTEYCLFVRRWTWGNGNNMTGWRADRIIEELSKEIM